MDSDRIDDASGSGSPSHQSGRPRDPYEELLENSTAVRFFGALALVIGIVLLYGAVYAPLSEAFAASERIFIRSGVVAATVIALICGTIMVIAGRHTRRILLDNWRSATLWNVLATGLIVAIGLAAEIYFEQLIEALGYTIAQ